MALVLTDKASSECFELRLKGCAWWHFTTGSGSRLLDLSPWQMVLLFNHRLGVKRSSRPRHMQ